MSQEIVKFDVNNEIFLKNSSDVKEEIQDEYYSDNKVCVSQTAININNTELNEYVRNDKFRKCETFSVDHVKIDLPLSEVNDTVSNNIKIEDGVYSTDTQFEYCNGLPFCNHCHQVYQDYCTKCRVLVHIMNKRPHNTYNTVRELPECMLETRESLGDLGIFSLKVIPEDVRFGPFTGLNSTRLSLKIKGRRFVFRDDQLEHLNWMQYINPARNIYEQNLFPFQYEEKLYYCSTRRIQKGEELLVYFGEEYVDNLFKNVEMDFVPIAKEDVEDVFACTFCCLGFRLKEYLAEHKTVCRSAINEMFSVEELVQCPRCKIYLEAKEYLEHHMDYCCEKNARYCALSSAEDKLDVERRSSIRSKLKRWKREMYRCKQCKFRTIYNADFRHHTNKHYAMKMYKCGICDRRYKTRGSLNAHVKKIHADNEGGDIEKYSKYDYFKANIKNMKGKSPKDYKCAECEFQTKLKSSLEVHIKTKHLKENDYKCAECEYKTCRKFSLQVHVKRKHLKQNDYKCAECEYQTNFKQNFKIHVKSKHLKQNDYKCAECEYETNYKLNLQGHIKTKHLKQNDFKCTECEYQTNNKQNFKIHVRGKHLKQNNYKCAECEYKTCRKFSMQVHVKRKHRKKNDYKCAECEFETSCKFYLQMHIRRKHLRHNDYKCAECEYQTNYKPNFKIHVKAKHLKQNNYKCAECEFKANYKSVLERHVKTKHLKPNDYKCAECEFQTSNKSYLQVHIKTKHLEQNDYKCEECEFQTNNKSYLPIHIKTKHLKPNDYKCAECEFQTNNKSYLQVHIKRKHLKQNDYKCALCEFKTLWKSSLKKHMDSKHLKQNDYKYAECEFQWVECE